MKVVFTWLYSSFIRRLVIIARFFWRFPTFLEPWLTPANHLNYIGPCSHQVCLELSMALSRPNQSRRVPYTNSRVILTKPWPGMAALPPSVHVRSTCVVLSSAVVYSGCCAYQRRNLTRQACRSNRWLRRLLVMTWELRSSQCRLLLSAVTLHVVCSRCLITICLQNVNDLKSVLLDLTCCIGRMHMLFMFSSIDTLVLRCDLSRYFGEMDASRAFLQFSYKPRRSCRILASHSSSF